MWGDSTDANNGDYVWSGSAWVKRAIATGTVGQWTNTTPLSGASLSVDDPLMTLQMPGWATMCGTMNVSTTWQVGWQACAPLPAAIRPKKQHFLQAKTGNQYVLIKITTDGIVLVDSVVSGSGPANWLLIFGSPWPTV